MGDRGLREVKTEGALKFKRERERERDIEVVNGYFSNFTE